MGSLALYSLYVALLLAVSYLLYKWTLSSATFFRFNRIVLMSIYAFSLLAVPAYNVLSADVAVGSTVNPMEEISAEMASLSDTAAPLWPRVIAIVYAIGIAVSLIFAIRSIIRIVCIIKEGRHSKCDGYTLVVTSNACAPFSWGRYIVVPASVDAKDMPLIIEHEKSHLRHRHWIELAVAQIVAIFNWFNPAAYLMIKEVQDVHEFEVDNDVISQGYDEKEYQMLLLRSAVGSSLHSIADGLTRSRLKTRLRMMMTEKSRPTRRLYACMIMPIVTLAIIGVRNSAFAETLSQIDDAAILTTYTDEVKYSIDTTDNGMLSHSIFYHSDGYLTSVSIELAKSGPEPKIYINGHVSSRSGLRGLRADKIDFIVGDNRNNRFVIKTK